MPAASSRRPWATLVRGRFEQSTHNAATGRSRHGFMVPMRGLQSVVAAHESAGNLRQFMVPMRGLRTVAAAHEPELGQEDSGQENGIRNLPAPDFPVLPFPGSGAAIAAVGGPWNRSMKLPMRAQRLGTVKDGPGNLCPSVIFGFPVVGSRSQFAGFGPRWLPMNRIGGRKIWVRKMG